LPRLGLMVVWGIGDNGSYIVEIPICLDASCVSTWIPVEDAGETGSIGASGGIVGTCRSHRVDLRRGIGMVYVTTV
jgi:hypothetical protein